MLITQQSQEELYRVLEENTALANVCDFNYIEVQNYLAGTYAAVLLRMQSGRLKDVKVVVVSVSPQSRASIAAKHNLTVKEASSFSTPPLQIGVTCD